MMRPRASLVCQLHLISLVVEHRRIQYEEVKRHLVGQQFKDESRFQITNAINLE